MITLPYIQQNGSWTLPDSAMGELWRRMEAEHTARKVFCLGAVKNEADWIAYMKSPANAPHVHFEGQQAVWCAWLNNVSANAAQAHMAGFRAAWGRSADYLKASFRFWFSMTRPDGGPLFDIIWGNIPSDNRLMIKLCERSGLHIVGEIPKIIVNHFTGESVGATFLYADRRDAIWAAS